MGANGAGKSNIISFFKMLSFMMSGRFEEYVARAGSNQTILHFGSKKTPSISAKLRFENSKSYDEYEFTLTIRVYNVAGDAGDNSYIAQTVTVKVYLYETSISLIPIYLSSSTENYTLDLLQNSSNQYLYNRIVKIFKKLVRFFEKNILVSSTKNTKRLKVTINCQNQNATEIYDHIIDKYQFLKEISKKLSKSEENITKITVILDVKSKTPMKSMYKEFQAFEGVESISIQEFNEG